MPCEGGIDNERTSLLVNLAAVAGACASYPSDAGCFLICCSRPGAELAPFVDLRSIARCERTFQNQDYVSGEQSNLDAEVLLSFFVFQLAIRPYLDVKWPTDRLLRLRVHE